MRHRKPGGFSPGFAASFPDPPEPGSVDNCAEAGVLGVLPGLIGTTQATEALKLILGIGQPLVGRAPGRAPIGARVTVRAGSRTFARVVAGGTSYLSAGDTQVLVGLGRAERADSVEVRWPSGRVQSWTGLPAGGDLLIEEGREPRPRAVAAPGPRLKGPGPPSGPSDAPGSSGQ